MAIDPYVYPDTTVLKNKLNIRDNAVLEEAEFDLTSHRILEKLPQGQFDYHHLKAIHKHIFQDLYDWAGQERTVRIAKDNSMFAYPEYIKSAIEKQFKELQKDNYLINKGHSLFANKTAGYFNEINAVHPFREGNGRTLRVFFNELAKQVGFHLNWEKVNRHEYLQASIAGFNSDNTAMEQVFKKIASPIKSLKEIVKNNSNNEPIEFPLTKSTIEALKDYAKATIEYSELSKNAIKAITQDKALTGINNKLLSEAKNKLDKLAFSIVEDKSIWKQLENKQTDNLLLDKLSKNSELLNSSQAILKETSQVSDIKK